MKPDWYKNVNPNLDRLAQLLGMASGPKPSHGYTIAEKAPEVVTAPGVYFPAEKGEVIPLESRQGGGAVSSSYTGSELMYPWSPFLMSRREAKNIKDITRPVQYESAVKFPEVEKPELGTPGFLPISEQLQKMLSPSSAMKQNRRPEFERFESLISRQKGGIVTPSSSKDDKGRGLDILESIIQKVNPSGMEAKAMMGLTFPPESMKTELEKFKILSKAMDILKPPKPLGQGGGGGGTSQAKTSSPKSTPAPNTGGNLPAPPTLPTVPTSMEGIPTPQSIQPEIRTDSPEIRPMSENLVNLTPNDRDVWSAPMFSRQAGGEVTPGLDERIRQLQMKYPNRLPREIKELAETEAGYANPPPTTIAKPEITETTLPPLPIVRRGEEMPAPPTPVPASRNVPPGSLYSLAGGGLREVPTTGEFNRLLEESEKRGEYPREGEAPGYYPQLSESQRRQLPGLTTEVIRGTPYSPKFTKEGKMVPGGTHSVIDWGKGEGEKLHPSFMETYGLAGETKKYKPEPFLMPDKSITWVMPGKPIPKGAVPYEKPEKPEKPERLSMTDIKSAYSMDIGNIKNQIMIDMTPDEQVNVANQPDVNILALLMSGKIGKSLNPEKKKYYIEKLREIEGYYGDLINRVLERKGAKVPQKAPEVTLPPIESKGSTIGSRGEVPAPVYKDKEGKEMVPDSNSSTGWRYK